MNIHTVRTVPQLRQSHHSSRSDPSPFVEHATKEDYVSMSVALEWVKCSSWVPKCAQLWSRCLI